MRSTKEQVSLTPNVIVSTGSAIGQMISSDQRRETRSPELQASGTMLLAHRDSIDLWLQHVLRVSGRSRRACALAEEPVRHEINLGCGFGRPTFPGSATQPIRNDPDICAIDVRLFLPRTVAFTIFHVHQSQHQHAPIITRR